MATSAKGRPIRIVIFIQENKTTDFYFPTLADWGAEVVHPGHLLPNAPDFDQPHDRNAWVHYKMGDYPAARLQVDTDRVIPFYSWLAKQFTFCDRHFGLGTNSTPGHMLAIGGQTPTLRNPPSTQPEPMWDLPTLFKHVERAGLSWGAFPDDHDYPVKYYTELSDPKSRRHIHAWTTTSPGSAWTRWCSPEDGPTPSSSSRGTTGADTRTTSRPRTPRRYRIRSTRRASR